MRKLKILLIAGAFALAFSPAQAKTYKCKDAKGVTYYTEMPPRECLGKEVDELSKQGTVIRRNEGMLSPAQLAEREAEAARKREAEAAAREEQRKNRALLNTYSSEKDIEDGRQRALNQVEKSKIDIQKRIADTQARAKKLEQEKEFYLKKPMPKKLSDDIKNNEIDMKVQQDALAAKEKDISEINAKYDEDKRRYHELTKGRSK